MQTRLYVQGDPGGSNFADTIREIVQEGIFDRLDVAVAYATTGGVKIILDAVEGRDFQLRWVFGLDDAITQPKVLKDLRNKKGSVLKVCSLGPGRRFHPKVFRFWSSQNSKRSTLLIGSGNLTNHGLQRNAEAGALLIAENKSEVEQHLTAWKSLVSFGETLSLERLADYETEYKRAKKARTKVAKNSDLAILADGELESKRGELIAQSGVRWIDIRSAMANGREIEFPKAMTASLGLPASGKSPVDVTLRGEAGDVVSATFKFREKNGMWRIHIPKEIPGSDDLRLKAQGKLQPSTKALLLTDDMTARATFVVSFVELDGEEYKKLVAHSKAGKLFDRTKEGDSGRNYGVF
ncbi:phospholipase D family protein [Qipengyuania seohaensis]|uniref:phospholipase D family protein n=1 Tax=Qipengyuania seohaensis TaxID=266951 RepID=UPI000C2216D4|nr:phospholipase D family protein [Qipengyuania seohaensis]